MELLKDYLVNSVYSFMFGISLINILGIGIFSIKEIAETWINEAFESLKEKYKI